MPKRSIKSIVNLIIELELNKLELNKSYDISNLKNEINNIKKKCITDFDCYYKKPILPLSPYLLFLKENPGEEEKWESLDNSEKLVYIDNYKKLKEIYNLKLRKYNEYQLINQNHLYSIS